MNESIVLVAGARTAFGAYGGGLSNLTATDLAVNAGRGALSKAGLEAGQVDHVVVGNVIQSSKDAIYMGRHLVSRLGMRQEVPGLILNLLCGSGVQAVVNAAMLIRQGQASIVLAGGCDALSMTPYASWSIRWGARMGHAQMWDGLDIRDTVANCSMGETAENLQSKYGINREKQDEYALTSQQRAAKAQASGYFKDEIEPVKVAGRKGEEKVIDQDEHLRPGTTIEALSKLKPAFKKDGTVTAGNACGIVDGASMLVVMSENEAQKKNLKPLSRILSWSLVGVPPEIMGIGPVPAIPDALAKAGLKMEDVELIEINEAFAVQYLACEQELGLNREIVNVNGGAIALGHPFGASGARLLLTLSLELKRRKARYGVASLCVGGGMGIAMVIEAL